MSAPNAELAYKVLDHIDAHPESWNQSDWICGTAACFGGHAVMLAGGTLGRDETNSAVVVAGLPELANCYASEAAQVVLGLHSGRWNEDGDEYGVIDGEQRWLFAVENTREDLGQLVEQIFGPRPVRPPYGTGCRCDWLGEGTPEHVATPMCRALRPDADRDGGTQ